MKLTDPEFLDIVALVINRAGWTLVVFLAIVFSPFLLIIFIVALPFGIWDWAKDRLKYNKALRRYK